MTNPIAFSETLRYTARRLAAYLIDSLALFAGVLVTQGLIYALGLNPIANHIATGESLAGWQLHVWVFATVSVPFWIYYARMHSSAWQATLGKRLTRLKVTASTGERLGFARALLRAIVMLLPFEVNHFVILQLAPAGNTPPTPIFFIGLSLVYVLIALYLGLMLRDPRRRSVHDIVAASVVTPS